jgi:hypothetical protein
VRVAFAFDCHHGEVIGWVATTTGISGEIIRRMMGPVRRKALRRDVRPAPTAMPSDRIDLRRP